MTNSNALKKLNLEIKFKLFLVTITFSDYIYILLFFHKENNFWHFWRKKEIIELFFEHLLFSYYGLYTNLMLYHLYGKIDNLTIFSTLLSSFSVVIGIFKIYKHRMQYNSNFKVYNYRNFKDFTTKTKILITNPFVCQYLKIFKVSLENYPDLY